MSVNRKNTNIELMGQSQNNHKSTHFRHEFDGKLAQDCSNYSVLAMELPQSCTKPSK